MSAAIWGGGKVEYDRAGVMFSLASRDVLSSNVDKLRDASPNAYVVINFTLHLREWRTPVLVLVF